MPKRTDNNEVGYIFIKSNAQNKMRKWKLTISYDRFKKTSIKVTCVVSTVNDSAYWQGQRDTEFTSRRTSTT
jgi:hypothetical protein